MRRSEDMVSKMMPFTKKLTPAAYFQCMSKFLQFFQISKSNKHYDKLQVQPSFSRQINDRGKAQVITVHESAYGIYIMT